MALRFSEATGTATSDPLAAGVWRATIGAGTSLFVVNSGAEWIPRRPVASRTAVEGAAPPGVASSMRSGWWWYALLLAALCAEWVMRRRVGLR